MATVGATAWRGPRGEVDGLTRAMASFMATAGSDRMDLGSPSPVRGRRRVRFGRRVEFDDMSETHSYGDSGGTRSTEASPRSPSPLAIPEPTSGGRRTMTASRFAEAMQRSDAPSTLRPGMSGIDALFRDLHSGRPVVAAGCDFSGATSATLNLGVARRWKFMNCRFAHDFRGTFKGVEEAAFDCCNLRCVDVAIFSGVQSLHFVRCALTDKTRRDLEGLVARTRAYVVMRDCY